MLWTAMPRVMVPVVYFPLWEKSFLLLPNDSFAFQVSEMCTAILVVQHAFLKPKWRRDENCNRKFTLFEFL